MASPSSTDASADPGTVAIPGFRIDGLIGRGPRAVVYAATQLDLDRPVALKLLRGGEADADRLRRLPWPSHPNAVGLYAAGMSEHGYLVMQRVRGPSLAAAGALQPAEIRTALHGAAAALDSLHAEGRAHGNVHAGNLFVEHGRGLLSDFGLGAEGGTPAGDRAAFAALAARMLGAETPVPLPESAAAVLAAVRPPARTRRRWALAGAAAAALAAVAAVVVALSASGAAADGPPPLLAGAAALGSSLDAEHVDTVDCAGRPATGGSEACTIAQTRLPGRPLVPTRGGVIRRWVVRGASGSVALDVLRRRGDRYFLAARTPYVRIADAGVHAEAANLPIRAGDLVGLEVAPGAAIGVANARGAATARWIGPIVLTVRAPDHGEPALVNRELLLRVEYVHGASWRPPGELTGPAAANAPPGQVMKGLDLDGGARVELLRDDAGIAVDLLRRGRRMCRLPVSGAKRTGRMLAFEFAQVRLGRPIVRLRWRNAGGRVIEHDYVVGSGRLRPIT